MEVRRDILLSIGASAGIAVVIAFGAIGLLDRMSPAIDRILRDNAASVDEGVTMLSLLAGDADGQPRAEAVARFGEALARARGNVTEDAEVPLLKALGESFEAALAGDDQAREVTVSAVQALIETNREAMEEANREALRTGQAGAWVAGILGLIGFLMGIVVYRRLRDRVVVPLNDIDAVLRDAEGAEARRCASAAGPAELGRISRGVNRLLDERQRDRASTRSPGRDRRDARAAVRMLLERETRPAAIVGPGDTVVFANRHALELDERGEVTDEIEVGDGAWQTSWRLRIY